MSVLMLNLYRIITLLIFLDINSHMNISLNTKVCKLDPVVYPFLLILSSWSNSFLYLLSLNTLCKLLNLYYWLRITNPRSIPFPIRWLNLNMTSIPLVDRSSGFLVSQKTLYPEHQNFDPVRVRWWLPTSVVDISYDSTFDSPDIK